MYNIRVYDWILAWGSWASSSKLISPSPDPVGGPVDVGTMGSSTKVPWILPCLISTTRDGRSNRYFVCPMLKSMAKTRTTDENVFIIISVFLLFEICEKSEVRERSHTQHANVRYRIAVSEGWTTRLGFSLFILFVMHRFTKLLLFRFKDCLSYIGFWRKETNVGS